MREVDIMSSFRHENILSLIGVVLRDSNNSPWMVFEYMPYGDLAEVLRANSPILRSPTPGLQALSKVRLFLNNSSFNMNYSYLLLISMKYIKWRMMYSFLELFILRPYFPKFQPLIILLDFPSNCN